MQDLFEGFQGITLDRWKQQLEKDLKGITFDELTKKDDSGLTIYPFYNAENSLHRGKPVFTNPEWHIASFVDAGDVKKANERALHDLNYGAESLLFITPAGKPADLLNKISIEHIRLNFVFNTGATDFVSALESYVNSIGADEKKLSGAFIQDPVNAAVRGYSENIKSDFESWKKLAEHSFVQRSGFTSFVTDAFPYHHAGASAVTELACTLAHMNEQLHFITENKVSTEGKEFVVVSCASINFFESVAKLRALRKLASFLLSQYGLSNPVYLQVNTSLINKTARDYWNNLIRSGIEGIAAVTGGADALCVFPYDFPFGSKDKNGRRWALDQQLIFREESLLSAVADPAAGSYFAEEYTHNLAEAAWNKFREIEKEGGLLAMLASGKLKSIIGAEANELKKQYASGEKVLIGVNKYVNEKENPVVRTFFPQENKNGLDFFIAESAVQLKSPQTHA